MLVTCRFLKIILLIPTKPSAFAERKSYYSLCTSTPKDERHSLLLLSNRMKRRASAKKEKKKKRRSNGNVRGCLLHTWFYAHLMHCISIQNNAQTVYLGSPQKKRERTRVTRERKSKEKSNKSHGLAAVTQPLTI